MERDERANKIICLDLSKCSMLGNQMQPGLYSLNHRKLTVGTLLVWCFFSVLTRLHPFLVSVQLHTSTHSEHTHPRKGKRRLRPVPLITLVPISSFISCSTLWNPKGKVFLSSWLYQTSTLLSWVIKQQRRLWFLSGTVENIKLHEEQPFGNTVRRGQTNLFQLYQEQIQLNDHGDFIQKTDAHVP